MSQSWQGAVQDWQSQGVPGQSLSSEFLAKGYNTGAGRSCHDLLADCSGYSPYTRECGHRQTQVAHPAQSCTILAGRAPERWSPRRPSRQAQATPQHQSGCCLPPALQPAVIPIQRPAGPTALWRIVRIRLCICCRQQLFRCKICQHAMQHCMAHVVHSTVTGVSVPPPQCPGPAAVIGDVDQPGCTAGQLQGQRWAAPGTPVPPGHRVWGPQGCGPVGRGHRCGPACRLVCAPTQPSARLVLHAACISSHIPGEHC